MRKGTIVTGVALALGLAASAAVADGHTSEFVGNKGFVGEAGAKGYVGPTAAARPAHSHATLHNRSKRRSTGPLFAVPSCPPKFNGMFRGNLYCIDGKPFS